jgi:hypothetical protein
MAKDGVPMRRLYAQCTHLRLSERQSDTLEAG